MAAYRPLHIDLRQVARVSCWPVGLRRRSLLLGLNDKIRELFTYLAAQPGVVKAAHAIPVTNWGHGFPVRRPSICCEYERLIKIIAGDAFWCELRLIA
jgi:hypothetical protein